MTAPARPAGFLGEKFVTFENGEAVMRLPSGVVVTRPAKPGEDPPTTCKALVSELLDFVLVDLGVARTIAAAVR